MTLKRSQENRILVPDAQYLRLHTFREYMAQFSMDAMATFEYEGLPETVSVKHIEEPLFNMGYCVFTLHKETGLPIVMPCGLKGINIHQEPTKFIINSRGDDGSQLYYQEGVIGVDGVIIRNNIYMKATYDMLLMYCRRIADAEMTIDMNVYTMRTPFIIETDQFNVQQNKLLLSMYDDFEPAIFTKKQRGKNQINGEDTPLTVHTTGVSSFLSELMNYKHDIENNMYTRFGINNAMQDKKERMVVDEVNAKEEQISLSQSISLDYRQFAIDEINKLFSLNIVVKKKGEGSEDEQSDQHTETDNSDSHDKL